ncbi:flippase [Candidatus Falkowbacteria bacterium]|nr:flippase [Patescibacteria group bacterium]MDD3434978.1 flippase [Patescibacteria group bacterium]MDD4466348.1 flippase [Patescibacteria group bacterium]NCU42925.1 flippase [Candidatus Falkowbacteria bacterium]
MSLKWKRVLELIPVQYRPFLDHEGFKKYFKNTGWMFIGQFFSLLISFFVGAAVARYLGPANYGVYNYALSFVGLFSFIAPLGVDAILYRELISQPQKRDELMGTAFRLKLIGGVIAFLAASVSAYFLEADFLVKLIVLVFSISFIFQAFNVSYTFFNSRVQSLKNVKVQTLAVLFSAVLKIIVIVSFKGVIWLALAALIESIIISVGAVYFYRQKGYRLRAWTFNPALAKKIISVSWLLLLSSAAALVYQKVDQVMVGRFLGNEAVGFYAVAAKLSEIWYFIPGIICGSLFPAIVNAKKTDPTLYQNRLKKLYRLMFFLALLIAFPLAVFSWPITVMIFGADYAASAPVLSIYAWSSLGFFLTTAINQALTSENRLRIIFLINLLMMLVNVFLNYLLIPRLGLSGAAWATTISYLLGPASFMLYERQRNRKLKKASG